MFLSEEEKRMLDGGEGELPRHAMELLVRYGEALGASEMVKIHTVFTGALGCGNTELVMRFLKESGGSLDRLYGRQALCIDRPTDDFGRYTCFACGLTDSLDAERWQAQEVPRERYEFALESERFSRKVGLHLCSTCAPYESGIFPMFGEHCASMESSAVSLFNSVLGARTNTEGMQSSIAAAFTGRVPKWGLHLDENRRGTHLIQVRVPVTTMTGWGLLGYYFGQMVQEKVPVVEGITRRPRMYMLKHCGAAAASSGGVELYHVSGVTPEARDTADAFRGNAVQETFVYGPAERRACYEKLNTGAGGQVDHVILGCPHYSLEQIYLLCKTLGDRRLSGNATMWVFAPYSVRALARRQGYDKLLERAGAVLLSDACPALSNLCPKHASCVATDSAKMAKYFHDMTGLPTYFGSMEDCVDAAVTGRWHGDLREEEDA